MDARNAPITHGMMQKNLKLNFSGIGRKGWNIYQTTVLISDGCQDVAREHSAWGGSHCPILEKDKVKILGKVKINCR